MTAPPVNDRRVEEKLCRILAPLDRHLDRGSTLLAAALIVVVPGTFLCLWMPGLLDRYRSLGGAFAAAGVVIAVGFAWDALASRLALWRFEWAFPSGSGERDVAYRMLNEMQTPTRAEDRLRELLAHTAGDRVRRNRHQLPPSIDAAPAIDPVAPDRVPASDWAIPTRPGYYDYIPLEPKDAEDRPPLGQG
ncbi:MAG: hypothetical protein ACRC33_28990 [Gemmataceae bacterium]